MQQYRQKYKQQYTQQQHLEHKSSYSCPTAAVTGHGSVWPYAAAVFDKEMAGALPAYYVPQDSAAAAAAACSIHRPCTLLLSAVASCMFMFVHLRINPPEPGEITPETQPVWLPAGAQASLQVTILPPEYHCCTNLVADVITLH
jgi:hypothetical protein